VGAGDGATARFDWYAATVDVDSGTLADLLAVGLEAEAEEVDKGMNGYSNQVVFRQGSNVVARMLYGGANGAPHAFASGDHTDRFVEVLRTMFRDQHRVSRCDTSVDFDGPGTWDRLSRFGQEFAQEHGVVTSVAGDWLTPGSPGGRTLYIGSKKSAVFLRIYEKGKQLQGIARDLEADGSHLSDDLVRVEIVVRPEKAAKVRAAHMEPLEAYGFAKWSQAFCDELFGLAVERVAIKHSRVSDDERAFRFMAHQYGAVSERLVADVYGGSWEAYGAALGRRLELEKARRAGMVRDVAED
jgi:DNA relaxase NicK